MSHVKSTVNVLNWLLIGCLVFTLVQPDYLLTQVLTTTTTQKFPPLATEAGEVLQAALLGDELAGALVLGDLEQGTDCINIF